ncbi:MAG TPA: NYN domain-containing protein [Coxiellaceae bacterium]|nr:MAG: NYN domain-containing protein [Gammaproteobacteria bacterium RIFCSPHIGHO2_12_FULL_36_30]HLB56869.1 NYN domain-containing protein [Coxiellaceae bacterium]
MLSQQRTSVYIDGFNLYYGCLKNSPYKWLDLKILFSSLLDDKHNINAIHYFTAHISDREGNREARQRQRYYLQAIAQFIPELTIHYGHYLTHEIRAKVVNPPPEFIKVYKTEEKGSDVNMALHILNDAWMNQYDCAVIVSNDSDLTEALRLVKNQHSKNIGLVFPDVNINRKPSRQLASYADFIKHIRHHLLQNSQLPDKIPGNNIIYKPTGW